MGQHLFFPHPCNWWSQERRGKQHKDVFLNDARERPRFDDKHLSTHPRSSVPQVGFIDWHHSETAESQRKILKGSRRKIYIEGGLQCDWWLTSQSQWGPEGGGLAGPTAERKPGNQEFCIQQNSSSKVRGIRKINQWNSLLTRPALNTQGRPSCWVEMTAEGIRFRKERRALGMVKAQVDVTESTNVSSHIWISIRDTIAWNAGGWNAVVWPHACGLHGDGEGPSRCARGSGVPWDEVSLRRCPSWSSHEETDGLVHTGLGRVFWRALLKPKRRKA